MANDGTERHSVSRQPDIRRRLRSRDGAAEHAIKTLLESLRLRAMLLRGQPVLLIGFTDVADDHAGDEARQIVQTLERMGASLRYFQTDGGNGAEQRADMMRALRGVPVVLIDTDCPYVRTLRPKEMRALGVEVIVATTLAA